MSQISRKDDIERIASVLTAPGLGRELGSYEATYRPFYQGLFMAPHTVSQALKTAMLASRVFENLGFETTPPSAEPRADIIQAIKMESAERLVSFCQGLQAASPVDSLAEPEDRGSDRPLARRRPGARGRAAGRNERNIILSSAIASLTTSHA